jgi:hypothetical protein
MFGYRSQVFINSFLHRTLDWVFKYHDLACFVEFGSQSKIHEWQGLVQSHRHPDSRSYESMLSEVLFSLPNGMGINDQVR